MNYKKSFIIYLILLTGLLLRLINLDQSLWLDEAINVLAAKELGFWHFVTGYPLGDFHPPGYFALLWIWGHLFGFSEIAVRFPSVLLGVGTIGIIYLIGKDFFNTRIALLTAFLLAINPLHVYYSQEARMYQMAAFAVSLSFYGLIKTLENPKKYWWIYSTGILLVLLSDYVAYLSIPAQILYVLIYHRKKIKQVVLSQALAGLIFSPWLLIFPAQLTNGQITAQNVPGWAQVVGGSSIKSFVLVYVKAVIGRVSIINKLVYGLLITPIGLFYIWLCWLSIKKRNPQTTILFFWVFLPTFIALVISFYMPVLSYFRMLFIIPGFCLLTAYAILLLSDKWQKLGLGFVVLVSLVCLFFYYTNPSLQRENWRGLKNYFETSTKKSLVLFENNEVITPFSYYMQNSDLNNSYQGGLKTFPSKTIDDVTEIDSSYQRIFLVDYLVGIADPERTIDQKLTKMRYRVIKITDFSSLGLIYEYAKSD